MRLFLAAIALLGFAAPAFATDFTDPRAVVEAAYAPYLAGDDFNWSEHDESALRSAELNALYARDAEEANGEIGRIDFDPLINAQDYQLTNLSIGEPRFENGTAIVDASFDNMGSPLTITIVLVEEGGEYRIDDVQSGDKDFPYSLKAILEAPMP